MIRIGNKKIGEDNPCFIIAEAGVNHNGDVRLAKRMIDSACVAGADAVKFQTFHSDSVVLPSGLKAEYQKKNMPIEESQLDMIRKFEISDNGFRSLARYAEKKKIIFLSTPFDNASVDLLNEVNVPAFKISSGEITNIPLLKYIAQKSKPVIISTGMAGLGEIEKAISIFNKKGRKRVILLHCVTCYPAQYRDLNLCVIATLKTAFRVPVGFSDHSPGTIASIAAVAMGSVIIEKHFTLDKRLPGPDHAASLSADELKDLVRAIRITESARGDGIKRISNEERKIMQVARRSLVTTCTIPKGCSITADMIACKRPGTGLSPGYRSIIIGKKTKKKISKDTIISWDMIE